MHPEERREYYQTKYKNDSYVSLDNPSSLFTAMPTGGSKVSEDDIISFIALMKFSTIVINFASTISLDAILFDTPVICPRFNLMSSFMINGTKLVVVYVISLSAISRYRCDNDRRFY